MKKFNKTISIEVEVDTIAQMLLDSMAPDFKHRELVAEAIIGTSVESNKIDYIYNTLNGYSNEIDFKVGDNIVCDATYYGYHEGTRKNTVYGIAVVKEINLYSKEKLLIAYTKQESNGEPREATTWVSHHKCTRIPVEDIELAGAAYVN